MNENKVQIVTNFIEQNFKAIVVLFAAFVLAVLIVIGLRQMSETREKEASELLFQAHGKAAELVKTDVNAAASAYDLLLEKYPRTRAAFDANLQIGDYWMEKGKYDEAAKRYAQAAAKSQDNFSKILAQYNLGAAYESAGEYQEAVKSYENAQAIKAAEFLRPELLMAEARCYEALKNLSKASEIYKLIQDKYMAKSFYSGAASVFLSEIAAKR